MSGIDSRTAIVRRMNVKLEFFMAISFGGEI
jgi:hypothetical protein